MGHYEIYETEDDIEFIDDIAHVEDFYIDREEQ